MARHAMIMAGGSGTRLWPLSRAERPKQLLAIIETDDGRRSLLEIAASRLEGVVEAQNRLICTGERYRAAIKESLPAFGDEQIIGEPEGRDTMNAVGLSAAVLLSRDPDAVFCVLTSDHVIEPRDVFGARMEDGFKLIEEDPCRLVTFTIAPSYPASEYGYVRVGDRIAGYEHASRAREFVEKPSVERAKQYLQSGEYGWNSGMFVFHARTFMECLERFAPENFAGITRIGEAWDTDERAKVLGEVYPTLAKTSVDYGVMEPASADPDFSICCVDMAVRWLDVGSWPSYGATLEGDAQGNRAGPSRSAIFRDSHDCLVVGEDDGHTVALLGCEGLVVVRTPDATLVMTKDKAQALKDLHGELPGSLK